MNKIKWQQELNLYIGLVSSVILCGNIHDIYPVIPTEGSEVTGVNSIDIYLCKEIRERGFEDILYYDPVKGFHAPPDSVDPSAFLERMKQFIQESIPARTESGSIQLTEHREDGKLVDFQTQNIADAAYVIGGILKRYPKKITAITYYSSRLIARPDDLDEDERMTFLYFQEGVEHAGKNRLFLIADKLNDLPVWYYLSNPKIKIIEIPKPDHRLREEFIKYYAGYFVGYSNASDNERKDFIDHFVGATEGYMLYDVWNVFQISMSEKIGIRKVADAVRLFQYGIQENPWMELDVKELKDAEQKLKKRVKGQDHVIRSAVDIVKRAVMGMSGLQHSSTDSKPRGIMFLAGPTGTGKTELAKALAELIFKDERNMIRFDMSEYRQAQSDQRLLGAPPGYVGYEAGGQLTNAVREHPFSVLLFDEIEKADPSIMDKFLQILDDGRITDGRGDTVYFRDCFIIFTSNLGMTIPSPEDPGIRITNVDYEKDTTYESVSKKIKDGVEHYFNVEIGRPELYNRIGKNVLVFDFIREKGAYEILDKQRENIKKSLLNEKGITLQIAESAEEQLRSFVREELKAGLGGRGIGNMVEEKLINPLSRYLFDNSVKRGDVIEIESFRYDGDIVDLEVSKG